MTLIMHIPETCPPGFLSCLEEIAPNYDESEISSPGARPRPGEMGSNERRERRQQTGASSGNIRSAETEPLAACSLNSALQV